MLYKFNMIRAEFSLGDITYTDYLKVLTEIDDLTGVENYRYSPKYYQPTAEEEVELMPQPLFSVLYYECDEEKFEKFFFKLKLEYPDFEWRAGKHVYSERS